MIPKNQDINNERLWDIFHTTDSAEVVLDRLSHLPDAAVHTLFGAMLEEVIVQNGMNSSLGSRFMAILVLRTLLTADSDTTWNYLGFERG